VKITGSTTLAELQEYLKAHGNPFVTIDRRRDGSVRAEVGLYVGRGLTAAEALAAAFTEMGADKASAHRLDAPGGPTCSCGAPSTHESGWCGNAMCSGPKHEGEF